MKNNALHQLAEKRTVYILRNRGTLIRDRSRQSCTSSFGTSFRLKIANYHGA